MTTAIQAEGLVKHFGATRALDGVDLAVPAGTILGLLGPNGSGKTTTVRILATLLTPDAGRVSVAGYDLASQPMVGCAGALTWPPPWSAPGAVPRRADQRAGPA